MTVPPPLPSQPQPNQPPPAGNPSTQGHPLTYQPPPGAGGPLPYHNVRCPRCGDWRHQKVSFTWWGGLVGPKLLSVVKCLGCGAQFNGKTGKSNTTGIVIYSIIGVVIGLAFLVVLYWMVGF